MPRPPNADAARTRERILDSALDAFAEHGSAGVSIREIGRRSGVTLSTVHHYFGTKEQLYEACIDLMYERLGGLRNELVEVGSADMEPEARLEDMARRAFRFARAHRSAIRLLLRSVVSEGQLDEKRRAEVQGPAIEAASALFGLMSGHPPAELRPAVQNIVFIVVRNAISSREELALVTGEHDEEAALAQIEDELVRTIRALILERS